MSFQIIFSCDNRSFQLNFIPTLDSQDLLVWSVLFMKSNVKDLIWRKEDMQKCIYPPKNNLNLGPLICFSLVILIVRIINKIIIHICDYLD